jgi:MFS family permease
MGMIGAAFGIGFTIGPAMGGIAAHFGGLSAPGWVAATICGLNALLAHRRLPESLPKELRANHTSLFSSRIQALLPRFPASFPGRKSLLVLLAVGFLFTFAFSNMEQTLSLFLQFRFEWPTEVTGLRAGLLLMFSGLVGAATQGFLVRKWAPRYGEEKLLLGGLLLYGFGMILFSFGPTYSSYFLLTIPTSIGAGLVQPSVASLVSRLAPSTHQGQALGSQQAFASLARVLGPLSGLSLFSVFPVLPFAVAAGSALLAAGAWIFSRRNSSVGQTV